MIGPVGYTNYSIPVAGTNMINGPVTAITKPNNIQPLGQRGSINVEKTQPSECQTCKNRKYMDVSDEANVSFQSPTHVSPQASFAAVSAHEQQHVGNAVSTGNQPGNQLISASVTYKMAVCPECGTPYVAGGSTRTQIQYNESNPYESSRKSLEGSLLRGMNFNAVA